MASILSLDPSRRTNAQAIRDAHLLGYINDEDRILDVTYNTGKFWKLWRPSIPPLLTANDLDPRYGILHYDWRALPGSWADYFDVVVFDPDYKLQGTSSNAGPASSNAAYGMDREYRSVNEQFALIGAGQRESVRVCKPGGKILIKVMDQVVSGDKVWMTILTAMGMDTLDCELVDQIHVFGHRAQPKDRKCPACNGRGNHRTTDGDPMCYGCDGVGRIPIRQVHTHGSFSTLMVFSKGKP